MEWKRIKSALIILFIFINLFLIYELCKKENLVFVNSEQYEYIVDILNSRNITLKQNIKDIKNKYKMQRIYIESEQAIQEDYIISLEAAKNSKTIGKSKIVLNSVEILTKFIKDTKFTDITIKNMELSYFYDSSQISGEVLIAEAEPVWIIDVDGGARYIYNAYTGDVVKKIDI